MNNNFEFKCAGCQFTSSIEIDVFCYKDSGRGLLWYDGFFLSEAPAWVQRLYRPGLNIENDILPDGRFGTMKVRDEFCSDICQKRVLEAELREEGLLMPGQTIPVDEWREMRGLPLYRYEMDPDE